MLLKAVVVVVVAVVAFGVINKLSQFGLFQHYFKHHPGTCSQVKGLDFGSENFRILSNGLTFVTSGFTYPPNGQGYKDFLKKNGIKGKIYSVDLNKSRTEAIELKIRPSKNFNPSIFRPHGIDVLEDPTKGYHLLYIVNHPEGQDDQVEKFKYLPESQELEHVKSFSSEQFHVTNDIALTAEDTFYITDYMYYKSHFMHVVEQLLGLKFGSILYFNGTDYTAVVTGLPGPNGVVLSETKRYAYIAMPHSQDAHVYEVNSEMGLKLIQEVRVNTMIDNFHLSQDGKSLYGGCHPIGMKTVQHLLDPSKRSPSQVIQLPLNDGRINKDGISQTFYDHGDLITGSSVGSVYKKKLLIGSIINTLAVCDLP